MDMTSRWVSDGPPQAPALVLYGSLGSTVDMWTPSLVALTEHFRDIRLELPGHGAWAADQDAPPISVARMASEALATMDELGLETVSWCGLSIGAMVGMHLGSEHPERITRLVLCCTSAHFPDRTMWCERATAVAAHGPERLDEHIVARWFTPEWAAANPATVRRARRWVAQASDAAYVACCKALAGCNHLDRLSDITVPTMLIAGSADPVTPAEPHAVTLADHLPDARLQVVAASHLANIEAADQVNRLILEHCIG